MAYQLTYHGSGMRVEHGITEREKNERVAWWSDKHMRRGFAIKTVEQPERTLVQAVTPKNMVWSYIVVEQG